MPIFIINCNWTKNKIDLNMAGMQILSLFDTCICGSLLQIGAKWKRMLGDQLIFNNQILSCRSLFLQMLRAHIQLIELVTLQGKDRYPYPLGYHARRAFNGSTYKMEIQEGSKGPLFVVCTHTLFLFTNAVLVSAKKKDHVISFTDYFC